MSENLDSKDEKSVTERASRHLVDQSKHLRNKSNNFI